VPGVARNLALTRAQGRYLHFLDDDDIVPEGHYAGVKEMFSRHPDVGVVFGRIEPFGNCSEAQLQHEIGYFAEAARRASICARFGSKWAYVGRMLFDRTLFVCSAAIVRRECVMHLGGFDPDISLMEDAEFYTRAIRAFGARFIDRIALRYRIGSPSLMHSPNPGELQLQLQRDGHRRLHEKYRRERGAIEFYSLALFTRTVLRVL
jgi:hypothetical protein